MNPLPYRLLLAALFVAALGTPALAQEESQALQQQAESAPPPAAPVRQAQPRSSSPRRESPRAESPRRESPRAESPRRESPRDESPRRESPRDESSRRESPRAESPRPQAAERSRGSDDQGRVRVPPRHDDNRGDRPSGRGAAPARAVPRDTAAPESTAPPPPPAPSVVAPATRTESRRSPGAASATADADEEQRRAQPRGSRPRGDNPTTGRAVPRDGRFGGDGRRDGGRRGTTVFAPRRGVYNNYYYYSYPRRWYPYGYGAFGLGYFYYDPYTWYSYDPYWSRNYYYYGRGYYGGGYGGRYGGDYGYYTGELRLRVHPRHAEVYVDGYFAGHVDDFDGTFQGLRLEEGEYRIEIVAPGYEPLEIDIRIQPGRKITYRGELRPRP